MECNRSSDLSERVNTNVVVITPSTSIMLTLLFTMYDTDDTVSDVANDDISDAAKYGAGSYTSANDGTTPDVNPESMDNITENVNLTLKTTQRFVDGLLSTVNCTSVAYSDMFNPMHIDVMLVLARVQKKIANYVHDYTS